MLAKESSLHVYRDVSEIDPIPGIDMVGQTIRNIIALLALALAFVPIANAGNGMLTSRSENAYKESVFDTQALREDVVRAFSISALKLYEIDITITDNGYLTDAYDYEGRKEGILFWASKWKERIKFGLKLYSLDDNKIRVTVYAEAWERPNVYWDWEPTKSFDRAETKFVEFKKHFKEELHETRSP